MNERRNKLIEQLKNKEYRDAFVSEHIDTGIPFQIRALRKKIPWTQKELAEHAGMLQERISVAENPNYSRFNIKTLKKIASAFDVALIIRFVPFSELVKWEYDLSPEKLEAVSFEKDPYFKPEPVNVPCKAGLLLGTFMSLEAQSIKQEPQEQMGKLYYLDDARQKPTENKMYKSLTGAHS